MMGIPGFIQRHLNQTVVYWGNPQPDGYGGYTYDDPIEISCRVEEVTEVIRSTMDEEIISRAAMYSDRRLDRGGYVYVGTLDDSIIDALDSDADPKELDNVMVVLANEKVPRLTRSSESMYKAYLNISKELRPPYVK